MYQSIIDKLESEKVTEKSISQVQVTIPKIIEAAIVAESKPELKKVSFKDKVKSLQSASNMVRTPVRVEVKKKQNIVELW